MTWQAASVTVPMSSVELVVNGEIRESMAVHAEQASGSWTVNWKAAPGWRCWCAGIMPTSRSDRRPFFAGDGRRGGFAMLAAGDAVTILEQIEGAMAYLDRWARAPKTGFTGACAW